MLDNSMIVLIGYLLGSIPFGLVLGPLFKTGDIRNIGSGNIGATNALRTGKKLYALLVLIGDGGKGALAVVLAHHFFADMAMHAAVLAGMAALIGHIFPVWLKFKGGKGVATSAGIILALHWPTGICCLAMWLVTARLSRISSLSALLAALHAPLYAMATHGHAYATPFALLAVMIWFTHRDNIKRLMNGKESLIGGK